MRRVVYNNGVCAGREEKRRGKLTWKVSLPFDAAVVAKFFDGPWYFFCCHAAVTLHGSVPFCSLCHNELWCDIHRFATHSVRSSFLGFQKRIATDFCRRRTRLTFVLASSERTEHKGPLIHSFLPVQKRGTGAVTPILNCHILMWPDLRTY